jgi:hypothetical protein
MMLGTFRAPDSAMNRLLTAVSVWMLAASMVACSHGGPDETASSSKPANRDPSGAHAKESRPLDLPLTAPGASTHRILLDARVLAQLHESAHRRSRAWQYTVARCEEAAAAPVASGYQGFEWADAVANLSLCWHATGEQRFATSAIVYLNALLDDRFKIGDTQGGADVVTHDSGYGIRTFAAYAALGYDWLRGAPGMSPAIQSRIVARLTQWLGWYGEKGYLRDHPISNYYCGYVTAMSFAGLAVSGEAPIADVWLRRAWSELTTKVRPAFNDLLAGGGWPEGWQYGEYTTMEVALAAEAFRTGAGMDLASQLPWLGQVVTYHVHALLPDQQSVYDGGTWGEHPAKPSGLALTAISVALDSIDGARASEARWMTSHALPPLRREQAWVGLLADRADAPESDPHPAAPLSLHVAGEGLSFARSDWTKSAVFVSLQAGPPLSEDHQDADQGHFEVWRGTDAMLVDGGDSEGSATSNHNTLLVDDGGRHLNYYPNQGVWGTRVRTTRFSDDGSVVVAVGDIGEAYAPSCASDGCKARSVEQMVRTFVYVRPSLIVIHDHVALERGSYGVVWAAHVTSPPAIAGSLASALVGQSRVDVRTLEPQDAQWRAPREPTPSGEGSHRANHPWGPMWRLELESPRGSPERDFLQVITVDRADAAATSSQEVQGVGLRGAVTSAGGRRTLILFADGGANEASAVLGGRADLVVVVGLAPQRRYDAVVDPHGGCTLRLIPSATSGALVAAGGFLRIDSSACEGK